MIKFLKLIKSNKGATAIEYGLIAALIAVAAIAAMGNIGMSWAAPSTRLRPSSKRFAFRLGRCRKAPPFFLPSAGQME